MHALSQEFDPTELPVFIWFVRGAMHSGKKWRSALWLNAMHSGYKLWIREFVLPYVFLLNPDYANNNNNKQVLLSLLLLLLLLLLLSILSSCHWIYLSADHLFQVYHKFITTAYFITKCDDYYKMRRVSIYLSKLSLSTR